MSFGQHPVHPVGRWIEYRAQFQKNHLFHIPYINACTFLLNPLHASIEKDIAPACYENNETKVTWIFLLLPQFLRLVPFYIDSLQILYMQHLIFAIVFLPAMHKIFHS